MIEVFGLFHKDEQQKNRIQQFQKLLSKESYIIVESEYKLEGNLLKKVNY